MENIEEQLKKSMPWIMREVVLSSDNLFSEKPNMADKLLIKEVAIEQARNFLRTGSPIGHYAYIFAVVKEAERRYGFVPAKRFRGEDLLV